MMWFSLLQRSQNAQTGAAATWKPKSTSLTIMFPFIDGDHKLNPHMFVKFPLFGWKSALLLVHSITSWWSPSQWCDPPAMKIAGLSPTMNVFQFHELGQHFCLLILIPWRKTIQIDRYQKIPPIRPILDQVINPLSYPKWGPRASYFEITLPNHMKVESNIP